MSRDGAIADLSTQEARIARPLRQLKILSLAEKGMSGGAVLSKNGELVGLIQKEWTSLTETSKGGAFALYSPDLNAQINSMLRDRSESLEMPLPFKIRRTEGELQFAGFRIHDRPEVLAEVSRVGGGHPDGIGGALPDSGIEVVGLTGEEVPAGLLAMEKVLRNVQSRSGVRMVIQGTESGQPITDLIALARLLLTAGAESAEPALDYNLLDIRPSTPVKGSGTPEALLEEAIVLSSLLINANPGLREYSLLIKNSYEHWLQTRSSKSIRELFTREPEFQPEFDRILDLAPELWSKVVELQTALLQLKKSLHQR